MSAQTQYTIQSTAGAVPVRNEKGNLKTLAFEIHAIVIFTFSVQR